jgi:hypothetical protein
MLCVLEWEKPFVSTGCYLSHWLESVKQNRYGESNETLKSGHINLSHRLKSWCVIDNRGESLENELL